MELPNGKRADPQQVAEKLTAYSLNFKHASGRHKARLFQSRLGVTLANQEVLVSAICEAAAKSTEAELSSSDQYGDRYVIVLHVTTEIGESDVLTAWIIRRGEDFPRLTSTYPIRS